MTRPSKSHCHNQRVVSQPRAGSAFHDGVRQMVGAVRPTLGPLPKMVAIAPVAGQRPPELLDDGGTIARRITDLPDRDADMGAMYVRSMLWRLHGDVGDGTATAAVLFEAVYTAGRRYLAAGGNATRLCHFLDKGLALITQDLEALATPVECRELLTRVAKTAGADASLSEMLGEIFDVIGEWGALEIRSGRGRDLERIYVEGMQWEGGILSSHLLTDATAREARIEEAAVLASDFSIGDPDALGHVMALTRRHQLRSLLIVCRSMSDRAIAFLLANQEPGTPRVVVVRAPDTGAAGYRALEDLSMLTGGKPLSSAAGDSPRRVELADLGRVRRAWANHDYAGVAGGGGDPRSLRRHILTLKAAAKTVTDADHQTALERRIGRLMGGSALLQIGGATAAEIKHRRATAERTATTLRAAIRHGILPGGGSALLACQGTLTSMRALSEDADERAAYGILVEAVASPARALAANAGFDPSTTIASISDRNDQCGLDVRSGRVVDMYEAGIVDAAAVQLAAVRAAVSSAALALTIDVLIHSKHPEEVLEP